MTSARVFKRRRQPREPRAGITGADTASVAQPAAVMHRQQQRRERPPRLVGGAPADDHELLLHPAFDLEPALGAARAIGRVGAFGDDAFELERAGAREHRLALGLDVIGIDQRPGTLSDQFAQGLLAVTQRQAAQILAVEREQIEQIIGQFARAAGERILQRAEIGVALRIRHGDLAVEHRVAARQRLQGRHQRRESVGPVEAVARADRHAAAGERGHCAIAVIFDFVEPPAALRRLVHQGRQLRRDEGGHFRMIVPSNRC